MEIQRIFGLDLLRFLAITSVVLGHGLPLLDIADTNFPFIPLGEGVDMFFVLSGFLIGGILIREFVVKSNSGYSGIIEFWKRRWFRTLPNYFLVLGCNYLFAQLTWNLGNPAKFEWGFLLFAHNLAWPFQGFFWESWSLSVEEWFYLLFPIFLTFSMFLYSEGLTNRKKAFEVVLVFFIFIPILFRILHFNPAQDGYQLDIQVRKVVIMRLDAIAMGIGLAYWHYHYYDSFKKLRYPLGVLGMTLFWVMNHYHAPKYTAYAQIWGFSLSPLSYALMLPFLYHLPRPGKWLSIPIEHVSKVSYSLYLVHLGLVLEPMMKHFAPQTPLGAWLKYGLFLMISLSAATLLYYFWERPTTKLRDRAWWK